MFVNLPAEIFKQILCLLSEQDMYHLLVVSKALYQISLPHLYRHLHIGEYQYTRQLQHGIRNNSLLNSTIQNYTKHLTLCSKKQNNGWRISDLLHIFGAKSNITNLTFSHYNELSTKMIQEVIAILPQVNHVEFKYCHIIACTPVVLQNNATTVCFNRKQRMAATPCNSFKSVSFTWTEFTHTSILPALFYNPHITHLELGSNRNKYLLLNELMVKSITTYCPNITHLSITLPQVSETTLCEIVAHYGSQLQQLSLRCDSYLLLHAIALYSRNLTHLAIRVAPSAENETINNYIARVIQSCTQLTELEVGSCYLEYDVPFEVWDAIVAQSQETTTTVVCSDRVNKKAEEIVVQGNGVSKKSNNTTTQQESAFGLSSRVWFDIDIFEDALQQRYLYNLLNGNRQSSNIHEKLVVGHQVLQKSLARLMKNGENN